MSSPSDSTPPLRDDGPQVLADHIERCRQEADVTIVMQSGSADDVVEQMLAAGWRLEERVEHVAGKRIRTLVAPDEG